MLNVSNFHTSSLLKCVSRFCRPISHNAKFDPTWEVRGLTCKNHSDVCVKIKSSRLGTNKPEIQINTWINVRWIEHIKLLLRDTQCICNSFNPFNPTVKPCSWVNKCGRTLYLLSLWMKPYCVTIQIKAIEQYFQVVLLQKWSSRFLPRFWT